MQRDDDELEETLKPDVPRPKDVQLRPEDALREARDTYGDSSASPNREDQEDMHRGAEE
ncbi:MAG: hypothetical protein JOY69_00775 [Candidatus Eremiobacteraeota bacterium]|nr:hypothetical protein [Candidatus Eremiobacteraeota bacterium]MBV8371766.1 hypothetical protein [Candidatus Eremiobacteraeota bacterium]